MLLEVFGLFLVLAIVLISVGLFQKESVHSIIGFTFLFVLGIILQGGVGGFLDQVHVQSGENITKINSTLTTVTYQYSELADSTTHWFGRFLAIGAMLGVVAVLIDLPRLKKKKDTTYD